MHSTRTVSRRGSVMIMVVALLVLLALMGTAWIATTRFDRGSSAQNVDNTRAEMMHRGVLDMVKATVMYDLFAGGQFRPAVGNVYEHLDSPDADANANADTHAKDMWLAERVPSLGGPMPRWRRISAGLMPGAVFVDPLSVFENAPRTYTTRSVIPTEVEVNGVIYPAFFLDANGDGQSDSADAFVAADTDGDGIADAGYVQLPGGPVGGVYYFAAVRIIDNNSAVNVTVAASKASVRGAPNYAREYLPTGIDLGKLMGATKESNRRAETERQLGLLDAYRSGLYDDMSRLQNAAASQSIYYKKPVSDDGRERNDFEFLDELDALWHQLGARPDAPGINLLNGNALVHFRRLPLTDMIPLAAGFVAPGASAGNSIVENLIPITLLPASSPRRYRADPQGLVAWARNFEYVSTNEYRVDGPYSRRPLIVTGNPVSNAISPRLPADRFGKGSSFLLPTLDMLPWTNLQADGNNYRGIWDSKASYEVGEIVSHPVQVGGGIFQWQFICIRPNSGRAPLQSPDAWEYQPHSLYPLKASLNTATFRELFRAYWQVMCDEQNPNETPFGPHSPALNDRRQDYPQRMFRPALRDLQARRAVRMTAYEQLQIRAALAAINTIDLRDADQDLTSRTFQIYRGSTPFLEVTAYGLERQPFITQVYAYTDTISNIDGRRNPAGLVAIELHNPHDTDLVLTNWRIGLLDRRTSRPNADRITFAKPDPFLLLPQVVIPAREYRVLTNYRTGSRPGAGQPGNNADQPNAYAATGLPDAVKDVDRNRLVYVRDLHKVLDREFVLMRPRRADGALQTRNLPYDSFDEARIDDLAPVDQHDLTGLRLSASPPIAYNYVRENDRSSGDAWEFVYGGAYDWANSGGQGSPRHINNRDGTRAFDWDELAPDPANPQAYTQSKIGGDLGRADSKSTFTNPFAPIQISGTGMPGPVSANGKLGYPFGGFARNGDVLAVPYIGAYRIRTLADRNRPIGKDEFAPMVELNSVTMDVAFADDCDDTGNSRENVGRFWSTDANVAMLSRYEWAKDLLDYVTVLAPQDDYLPNIDPVRFSAAVPAHSAPYTNMMAVNNQIWDSVAGVEGLVNINTAPWPVLATLPMLPDARANSELAKAIVADREAKGPFRTVFDLHRVVQFQNAVKAMQTATGEPDDQDGDFSPPGAGATDGVRNDFEEQFLLFNRISNMITVRSDSFVAYTAVQGWRLDPEIGPRLVVNRKAGLLIDRSNVTPYEKDPRIMLMPLE